MCPFVVRTNTSALPAFVPAAGVPTTFVPAGVPRLTHAEPLYWYRFPLAPVAHAFGVPFASTVAATPDASVVPLGFDRFIQCWYGRPNNEVCCQSEPSVSTPYRF